MNSLKTGTETRATWETYLWRVERVGFWDFNFKVKSATYRQEVKGWQGQIIRHLVVCQVSMVQVSGDTFVWCVWGTCYLPPQLCEVVAHHLHFDLVFTRLWMTMKVKNLMRSILYFTFLGMWNMKPPLFGYLHADWLKTRGIYWGKQLSFNLQKHASKRV